MCVAFPFFVFDAGLSCCAVCDRGLGGDPIWFVLFVFVSGKWSSFWCFFSGVVVVGGLDLGRLAGPVICFVAVFGGGPCKGEFLIYLVYVLWQFFFFGHGTSKVRGVWDVYRVRGERGRSWGEFYHGFYFFEVWVRAFLLGYFEFVFGV